MKDLLVLTGVMLLSIIVVGAAMADKPRLKLATTTSTENSGLLDELIPAFEKECGCIVDVIAVGTGKALQLGRQGDVDVVLVHAPKAEEKFVAEGYGLKRHPLMHNDFVIIGPKSDPAKSKEASSAADAFKRIAEKDATFVSRGDNSGTNKKEQQIWESAGMKPEGSWYVEAGQGMGKVLMMANEKGAYTLTDRGTYIAYDDKIDLEILFEGDEALFNPYGVIIVNPKKHPHVKKDIAEKFVSFLTGEKGQKMIGDFRMNGKQLFHPDVVK